MKPFLPLLFFAFLLARVDAFAQDVNQDGFVTYLVPISAPDVVPGANGTLWKTELWVHNGIGLPLALICSDVIVEGIPPCPAFHPPGTTEQAFNFETRSRLGAVLFHLPPDSVGSIDLSSRLFELSRHAQPAGVYMPVVREDRFYSSPVRFIGVPASSASRVALRVYDPRRHAAAQVRVELINTNGSPIADTVLTLQDSYTKWEPGVGSIFDLAAMFPQLRNVDRFDIRVTPLSPVMDYWALVSVTDWDTQQVVLITAD
jgi:hypothetical protein